jgi:hypothetical protein
MPSNQRNLVFLREGLDMLDEILGDLLQVPRFNPIDAAALLKEHSEHADVLHVHDVTTHAHAINQRILPGDVLLESFGQRHGVPFDGIWD